MTTRLSPQEYRSLELIAENDRHYRASWLRQIVNRIAGLFSTSDEPQVWATNTRDGRMLWSAYDPVTYDSIAGVSHEEMQVWLEDHRRHGYASERLRQQFMIQQLSQMR
ncbi:MAG: hypothetical protein KME20_08005 [Kaiparowitsia implicata GSE-PSE-MK54-09C]|nr:hypothetical protein [Kaiparowitsia implicata GSE-PSE-MK54-09C]